MERQLLTAEQIWKDLDWVEYNKNSGWCFIFWITLAAAWFALAILGQFILSWLCGVASVLFMVKIFTKPSTKSGRDPCDLLINTDVCVNKEEGYDNWETGSSIYLTFEKEGRVLLGGAWKTGYPSWAKTEIGDSFYVVSHKNKPKIKKFYSMKEWYLTES